MYQLTAICTPDQTDTVLKLLQATPQIENVICQYGVEVRSGKDVVTAFVHREAADEVLARLRRIRSWQRGELYLNDIDLALSGEGELDSSDDSEEEDDTLSWEVILARARGEGRMTWWYLTFMAMAGIMATVGLVGDIPAVIVGAMAVSPDLSPANAVAVTLSAGLVHRSLRALRTLVFGLGLATIISLALTLFLEAADVIESGITAVDEGMTTFVSVVDGFTVIIAITAGVAAMVAFIIDQDRTAVGVAISVTTIPAAAYVGVALADGAFDQALGGLSVLVVNILFLTLTQIITLSLAKRWRDSKIRRQFAKLD